MTRTLISPASSKKVRNTSAKIRKLIRELDPNPWDDECHNRKWVLVKVGNKWTKVQVKSFRTFIEARDFAAANVKGFPGWRVTQTHETGEFVIELSPGHYFTEEKNS